MTRPDDPLQARDELTDSELDAVLAIGDSQLLNYVREHTNPIAALTALLDITAEQDHEQAGWPGSVSPAQTSHFAAYIISWRIHVKDLIPNLNLAQQLIDVASAVHGLATTIDLVIDNDIRALDHYLNLLRDRVLEHALGLDLDRALDEARALSVALNRARVRDLARDLLQTIEGTRRLILSGSLGGALVSRVESVRDDAAALARALIRDLDHARDNALARAQSHVRALNLGRASDLDDEVGRAEIGARARTLADELAAAAVDASGADLTGLAGMDADMEVLAEVVWDLNTRWPEVLYEQVIASSKEISPGVYRVVPGGTERDRHPALGV